jgi:hypothetical protein
MRRIVTLSFPGRRRLAIASYWLQHRLSARCKEGKSIPSPLSLAVYVPRRSTTRATVV